MPIIKIILFFFIGALIYSCRVTKRLKNCISRQGLKVDSNVLLPIIIPYKDNQLTFYLFENPTFVTVTTSFKVVKVYDKYISTDSFLIPVTRKGTSSVKDFKIGETRFYRLKSEGNRFLKNLDIFNSLTIPSNNEGCREEELKEAALLNDNDRSTFNIAITYKGKWLRYQYYDINQSVVKCPTSDRLRFQKLYHTLVEL